MPSSCGISYLAREGVRDSGRGAGWPDASAYTPPLVMANVAQREGFEQVCVIQGLRLGDTPVAEFETKLGAILGVRVQILETVLTLPSRDAHGAPVPETGGRSDVLFAFHNDDYSAEFNAERMARGIRWLEDAISRRNNPHGLIYPERIRDYLDPKIRGLID